jgi:predicted nucleic acid-binding protein
VTVVVDTSALLALLRGDDQNHHRADEYWQLATERGHDLVVHGYVVSETVALCRARLGWDGVDALVGRLLPGIRFDAVDRDLHDQAMAAYLGERGGTSFIDRVTIEYARRNEIVHAFAFDSDLVRAGLAFPPDEKWPA